MTERRDQRTRDRSQSRFAPLVKQTLEVLYGSDDFCHCARPATDAELGLDSSQEWCWLCHRPLDPSTLIGRIRAFLA